VSGADNQQERPFIEAISASRGCFLLGFALGEGSFMLVCRKRGERASRFRISAAAEDVRLWRQAVMLLSAGPLDSHDYVTVLALRERMNRGGKRRHRMDGILRDYTPSPLT
jgi:hypothetical protein